MLNLHNDRYSIPFVVLDQDRLPIVYGFQFNFQCLQINNSGTILQSTKYLGETFDDPLLVGMRYASPNSICYLFFPSHPFPNYTQQLLHTHRCCSTEGPLHRDLFTIKRLYTKKLWRTVKDPFPQKALQREAVTRSSFYTQTLLRTGAFRHRSFYTQNLLHREAVAQNKFRHTFGRPKRTISAERLPKPP